MRGFDPGTPLTKAVCRINVLLAVPYLVSTLIVGLQLATHAPTDPAAGNTHGGVLSLIGSWRLALVLAAVFLFFIILLIYGLLKERPWVRWLILLDVLGGYLFALTFPVVGAVPWHPGKEVYAWTLEISPFLAGDGFIWVVVVGKTVVNTFNAFYFFGHPVFRVATRFSVAHTLWVIPSAAIVLGTIYVIATLGQFQSPLARYRAEQEFRKVTCADIRRSHGRERDYSTGAYSVTVRYSYDFTSVSVTMPSGRAGFTGGPGY